MIKNRKFTFLFALIGLIALGFGQLSYSGQMRKPCFMMQMIKKQQEEINQLRKKLGMEPIQFPPMPGPGKMQKMSDRFEGLKRVGEELGLKMPEQPVPGKCTLIPVLEELVKRIKQLESMVK